MYVARRLVDREPRDVLTSHRSNDAALLVEGFELSLDAF